MQRIEETNVAYLGAGMYLFEAQRLSAEQQAAFEQDMEQLRHRIREAKERLKMEVSG